MRITLFARLYLFLVHASCGRVWCTFVRAWGGMSPTRSFTLHFTASFFVNHEEESKLRARCDRDMMGWGRAIVAFLQDTRRVQRSF